MNYFELYQLPIAPAVNFTMAKQKFYELSRKYHPDFFINANEEVKADMLEQSSLINKAFKTFSNKDETIKYFLQLKGYLQEEEKYQLAPTFLMEIMELNEQLMEAKMENDEVKITNIKSQILQLQSSIYEPIQSILENYQADNSTEKELLQIKEYYYQKKYLNRILESIH